MAFIYRLENLKRYYKSKEETIKALDGIDTTVNKGDFIALLGPSGSGKTTLLNLLTGLDKATSGTIYFHDLNFSSLNDSQFCDLRRFQIGIIFQFYNLHPSLTAQENVEYPMMIANIPKHRQIRRALELLESVDLLNKRDNYPPELSGGEQQRVGIARALANDPEVIIADEPTGDLDSELAQAIIELLVQINTTGKTIVMVTHDESLLRDEMRVIRLIDGRMCES
ncbi:MAG: ABC transporter ATP-binding protein [Candidatus Thorarchaeota archaeon]